MAEGHDREAGLEPIAPLVEWHEREMGPLAGRLMAALSLLVDLEDSFGWDGHPAQPRATVHYARLLVASVLRQIAAEPSDSRPEA